MGWESGVGVLRPCDGAETINDKITTKSPGTKAQKSVVGPPAKTQLKGRTTGREAVVNLHRFRLLARKSAA
jgi:hypothetical protein